MTLPSSTVRVSSLIEAEKPADAQAFGCFVTGTDTEIGKTLVSSALLIAWGRRGLRTVGMKPVAAGTELHGNSKVNEDVQCLKAASTVQAPPEWVSPYLWDDPIAPHIAARQAGVQMDPQVIIKACRALSQRADVVVVEGVGGFCVPLSDSVNMADVAKQLNLPVVLVVGLRLGCISHALLTSEAIAARGLRLVGWVANTVDSNMPYMAENIATLKAALPAPLLGHIPRLETGAKHEAADYLDLSVVPEWRTH